MTRSSRPTPCEPASRTPCRDDHGDGLSTYADVVAVFIRDHRPEAKSFLCFFRNLQSWEQAIDYAEVEKLLQNQHLEQDQWIDPLAA
jgi:hypothetical protein